MPVWIETGTLDDRDDIGGDIQAGRAFCRRFADRTHGAGAVVDVHYYAAQDHPCVSGARAEFWVGRATTYTRCTDIHSPGDTEDWSDAMFSDGDRDQATFTTAEAAEHRAEQLARAFSATDIRWDGQPFRDWSRAPHPK
ncbi:hypothetical protein [Streptomyces malaysiensis]|uniref:hypothetical protein n=1 Tax=Streptomyces malaysiensis TaxID=92644 RepID=UPI0011CD6B2A|nr:hypothetical protein [Streptomyces malaysiensis]